MPRTFQGVARTDSTRAPSVSIWKDCPWLEIESGQVSGVKFYDDFTTLTNTGANAQVPGWKITGANGTAAMLATDDGGVAQLATGTTQNNEAYAVYSNGVGGFGQIISASPNNMWYECRFRVQSITAGSYFIGVAKPSDVAAGFLADTTGALVSTANYVGARVIFATPSKLDIVYAKGAAATVYLTAAQTLVANTWYKFGFRFYGLYDGGSVTNHTEFFINGARQANTAGTATNVAAGATNFPSSIFFTPALAAKNPNDTTNVKLDVDWVRFAMNIDDQTYG